MLEFPTVINAENLAKSFALQQLLKERDNPLEIDMINDMIEEMIWEIINSLEPIEE